MRIAGYKVSEIRKAVVAWVAAIGVLLVSVLEVFAEWIPDNVAAWITTAIAVLGGVGVFLIRNAPILDGLTGQAKLHPSSEVPPVIPNSSGLTPPKQAPPEQPLP